MFFMPLIPIWNEGMVSSDRYRPLVDVLSEAQTSYHQGAISWSKKNFPVVREESRQASHTIPEAA
jgi:hypothetical protein